MPEQVSPAVRQRRRDELVSLQQRISEGFAQSLVGRTLEVLVDALGEDGGFIGRTEWDAPDGALDKGVPRVMLDGEQKFEGPHQFLRLP
jgi:tRNA A37 methylthiotransferase MiaB